MLDWGDYPKTPFGCQKIWECPPFTNVPKFWYMQRFKGSLLNKSEHMTTINLFVLDISKNVMEFKMIHPHVVKSKLWFLYIQLWKAIRFGEWYEIPWETDSSWVSPKAKIDSWLRRILSSLGGKTNTVLKFSYPSNHIFSNNP